MKANELVELLTRCINRGQNFETLIHDGSAGPKEIQEILFIDNDSSYTHQNAIVLIPKD